MTHSSPLTPRSSIRTLSIGGATYDLFIRAHDLFPLSMGQKVRVDDVVGSSGGGAANTSVALSRLGFDASFCGILGNDQWGAALSENFRKEKVDTALATIVEHEASSFSLVLLNEAGERVILNHPGVGTHLHDVTFDREGLKNFDAIFLNHLHAESREIEDDLINQLEASPDIHLSWNPGGCQIRAGIKDPRNASLLSRTDLLFLNKEEALEFANTKTVKEALHILSQAGSSIVCITDGKNGAMATDGKEVYSCPIIPCEVLDVTGAGDAFGSAATWAVLRGLDLPTALRAGTINAMSVVGAIGAEAGLLTETQLQHSLSKHPHQD